VRVRGGALLVGHDQKPQRMREALLSWVAPRGKAAKPSSGLPPTAATPLRGLVQRAGVAGAPPALAPTPSAAVLDVPLPGFLGAIVPRTRSGSRSPVRLVFVVALSLLLAMGALSFLGATSHVRPRPSP
jgi:hypothetical protein